MIRAIQPAMCRAPSSKPGRTPSRVEPRAAPRAELSRAEARTELRAELSWAEPRSAPSAEPSRADASPEATSAVQGRTVWSCMQPQVTCNSFFLKPFCFTSNFGQHEVTCNGIAGSLRPFTSKMKLLVTAMQAVVIVRDCSIWRCLSRCPQSPSKFQSQNLVFVWFSWHSYSYQHPWRRTVTSNLKLLITVFSITPEAL